MDDMARRHIARLEAISALFLIMTGAVISLKAAQSTKKYSKEEVKALLNSVWRASELDLNNLPDYVFSEREVQLVEIKSGCRDGLGLPQYARSNYRLDYVWFVRDGHLVRSLTQINGKEVTAGQQRTSEEQWVKEEKDRVIPKTTLEYFIRRTDGGSAIAGLMQTSEYKYAGEKELDGRDVIILKATSWGPLRERYTLYVSKDENRIVRSEIDCAVPGISLKHLMIMEKPIDNKWLPKIWAEYSEVDSPGCRYLRRYMREFHSFKKSDVKAKLWFQGSDAEPKQDKNAMPPK
jgi:hypothetical protein